MNPSPMTLLHPPLPLRLLHHRRHRRLLLHRAQAFTILPLTENLLNPCFPLSMLGMLFLLLLLNPNLLDQPLTSANTKMSKISKRRSTTPLPSQKTQTKTIKPKGYSKTKKVAKKLDKDLDRMRDRPAEKLQNPTPPSATDFPGYYFSQ